jgi:diguanylate cyclase (GGDEF)-like protein
MIDFDHFKLVNDNYGHVAGDRVLMQVADLLRATTREVDRVGRFGGEEFMVILPATGIEESSVFLERLRREVARHDFQVGRTEPIHMTVSAGVASYPHPFVSSKESLLRLADEALYAAKAAGRNCVMRFDQIEAPAVEEGSL